MCVVLVVAVQGKPGKEILSGDGFRVHVAQKICRVGVAPASSKHSAKPIERF